MKNIIQAMPSINNISRKKTKPFSGMKGDRSFYHTPAWRKTRDLKKKKNPICEVDGCNNPMHTVDHITPINKGGAKLDMLNLQSLCKRCNAIKTRQDRLK